MDITVDFDHVNFSWKVVSQRCCYEKVFWKYVANLEENTHTKVWIQLSKSLFDTYVQKTFL